MSSKEKQVPPCEIVDGVKIYNLHSDAANADFIRAARPKRDPDWQEDFEELQKNKMTKSK